MKITLVRVETVAPEVKTFWFEPERAVRYSAGQFADVYLPHEAADARGIRRWLTLSSSPTEPLLGMTVIFDFGSPALSSFKRALLALQPGDPVQMLEPMGDIVLPKDPSLPLVFVAGGIGIVPFRSIARWMIDQGERRPIKLLYSETTEPQFLYVDLLQEAFGEGYLPTLTRPHEGWRGQTGRISVDRVLELAGGDRRALFYIAGPQSMTEMLVTGLQQRGIARPRIAADYFNGLVNTY